MIIATRCRAAYGADEVERGSGTLVNSACVDVG